MARIYVYSPSGAVRDRAAFWRGVRLLQSLGHEVEIDPDALTRWQRFAGDDQTRLAAIGRAAASGADVALISRGGYGITRLLPDIDWAAIAGAAESGTRFVGFSDFTAMQLAALKTHQAITWAGPALCEGFGQMPEVGEGAPPPDGDSCNGQADEITAACFEDMISGAGEGTGWQLPAAELDAYGGVDQAVTIAEDAVLWGGNLSLVEAMSCTPWWPDIDGGVLFLEDVGEHPYRVERMLIHLLQAGVLPRQQAIVLGQFTGYQLYEQDGGYSLKQAVAWLRERLSVPVLTGLPFGHQPTKVLLPVGARVHLLLEQGEALILWGHLH